MILLEKTQTKPDPQRSTSQLKNTAAYWNWSRKSLTETSGRESSQGGTLLPLTFLLEIENLSAG